MLTKKSLRELKSNSNSDLEKSVITDILSQGSVEEINSHVGDVLNHGCISGIVSSLIYYTDTKKFFIKHMDEILEMAEEMKNDCGEISFELTANNFAWFGYEETLRNIVNQIDPNTEY